MEEFLTRLSLVFLIPLFFMVVVVLIIIYFIVMMIGIIIADPFVWIMTQRTFFLAFAQDKLWSKGELLGASICMRS